ncbi:MAG: ribosome small subunit-dependent GTPase A [Candidatus Tyloplasma litorale]|nr:MAG: ribosome small subunit-dependent GTPase A [Mycoplasmatales bacterium]
MAIGKVIYSSGGNYKVLIKGRVYFAKPLGIFRNEKIKIIVGDNVEVQINENKHGLEEINVITKLLKRKNEFIRPNISNVDNAILVTSITNPKLNDFYLDKLITIFNSKNVEPILIFSKSDLLKNDEKIEKIINEYRNSGFKILTTDNKITFFQKKLLHKWTKDKLSVITGQTGVGKSTLLNNLNDKLHLKTGEISQALGRGKHTTRHSEAFEIFKNSYIVDTPGFSSLNINQLSKNEISWNFMDFEKYAGKCKFSNCLHIYEAKCEIKKMNYSKRTMKNYEKLLEEKDNYNV